MRGECERLKLRRCDLRFSRRGLREAIDWGDTQLKIHLARLVELEYIVAHRTATGGHAYELVYEVADAGHLRFPGLADIEALRCAYDSARSGQSDARSGSGRPVVGVNKPPQSQQRRGLAAMRPAKATECTAPRPHERARRTRSPSP